MKEILLLTGALLATSASAQESLFEKINQAALTDTPRFSVEEKDCRFGPLCTDTLEVDQLRIKVYSSSQRPLEVEVRNLNPNAPDQGKFCTYKAYGNQLKVEGCGTYILDQSARNNRLATSTQILTDILTGAYALK